MFEIIMDVNLALIVSGIAVLIWGYIIIAAVDFVQGW